MGERLRAGLEAFLAKINQGDGIHRSNSVNRVDGVHQEDATHRYGEIQKRRKNILEQAAAILPWTDHTDGGWLRVLLQSLRRFQEMRGFDAAASLAYYALFSIFPLTLVLASVLGFFFRDEMAYQRTISFIHEVFPFSGELIDQELRAIYNQRGTFGVIGGLGLIWAASGFFTILASNINMAWPTVKLRGYVHTRLVAIGMVGGLALLMIFSILTTTLISVLQSALSAFAENQLILQLSGWLISLRVISALFTYTTFLAIYRWVPNKRVRWKHVMIGALIVTLVWEVARALFTLYLSSGLARFEFIYGSLGALFALMVWIYFGNAIALYGAYLVATLDSMNDIPASAKTGEENVANETPKMIRG